MRFWRAGTGHVRGGGQYDLMESVSAKGGFEPASELTSKQVRSKIESYGFGLRAAKDSTFYKDKPLCLSGYIIYLWCTLYNIPMPDVLDCSAAEPESIVCTHGCEWQLEVENGAFLVV